MIFSWADQTIHLNMTGWILVTFSSFYSGLHPPFSTSSLSILLDSFLQPPSIQWQLNVLSLSICYSSLFRPFSILACGLSMYLYDFFARDDYVKAAGKFSSYPSALKPQRVTKAERGDRQALRMQQNWRQLAGKSKKINNKELKDRRDIMWRDIM